MNFNWTDRSLKVKKKFVNFRIRLPSKKKADNDPQSIWKNEIQSTTNNGI